MQKPDTIKGHQNLIIVTEELAELTQEITKYLRDKGNETGILEELADVLLCVNFVTQSVGISDEDLEKAYNIKAKRLKAKLDKHEFH